MNVCERIQKLLSLSKNNDSVQEAALAAQQAQDLMFRYGIGEGDLETSGGERERETVVNDVVHNEDSKRAVWKACLANAIAQGFGCHMYTFRDYSGSGAHRFHVVGLKSVVQTVSYMFGYLSLEVERLCCETWDREASALRQPGATLHGKARTWKNNFRMGAVAVIRERLQEQVQRQKAEFVSAEIFEGRPGVTSTSLALYKQDQERVEDHYRDVKRKLNLRASSIRQRRDRSAYERGRQAGQGLSLGGGNGLPAPASRLENR